MPRPSSAKRPGFTLGQRISPREFLGIAALVFALVGLAWFGVTATGFVGQLFLPSPGQVVSRLGELWVSGDLVADMKRRHGITA